MVQGSEAGNPRSVVCPQALERIQRWLLTEVADLLSTPCKLSLTIHLDESHRDIRTVIEKYETLTQ